MPHNSQSYPHRLRGGQGGGTQQPPHPDGISPPYIPPASGGDSIPDQFVHVATVTSAHGVQGQFKLFCLLENPQNLARFKEFFDESGHPMPIKMVSLKGKQPIASMAHILDKNAADLLKQKKIFVRESDFPQVDDGAFYAYQLVGLNVLDATGATIGTVHAHHDFGAGDVLEIKFPDGSTELYPFKDAFFPKVDIAAGTILFSPPTYL